MKLQRLSQEAIDRDQIVTARPSDLAAGSIRLKLFSVTVQDVRLGGSLTLAAPITPAQATLG